MGTTGKGTAEGLNCAQEQGTPPLPGNAEEPSSRKRARPSANGDLDLRRPDIGEPARNGAAGEPRKDAVPRQPPAPEATSGNDSGNDAAGARVHPASEDGDAGAGAGGRGVEVGTPEVHVARLQELLGQAPAELLSSRLRSRAGSGTSTPRMGSGVGLGPSGGLDYGAGLAPSSAGFSGGYRVGPGFSGGFGGRSSTPWASRMAARGAAGPSRLGAGSGPYALGGTPLSQRAPTAQRCVISRLKRYLGPQNGIPRTALAGQWLVPAATYNCGRAMTLRRPGEVQEVLLLSPAKHNYSVTAGSFGCALLCFGKREGLPGSAGPSRARRRPRRRLSTRRRAARRTGTPPPPATRPARPRACLRGRPCAPTRA